MQKYKGKNLMGGTYRLKCGMCSQESIGLKSHLGHFHKRCTHDPKGKWGAP